MSYSPALGYTIEVAGSEGFLNILPIYLDHVLYPTLTDSGFHTEVHHINGEGADAGMVLLDNLFQMLSLIRCRCRVF